jgi:hypothetical protein
LSIKSQNEEIQCPSIERSGPEQPKCRLGFSSALIKQYHRKYAEEKLGIAFYDLLTMGRQNPEDMTGDFNMAYLAIRGSGTVNGVSRLHAESLVWGPTGLEPSE